jgi:hypothetical protein
MSDQLSKQDIKDAVTEVFETFGFGRGAQVAHSLEHGVP